MQEVRVDSKSLVHGFPHSLQADTAIVPEIRPLLLLFDDPTFHCYIV